MPYASHNEDFVVDLKAIPVGAKIAAVAMMELLGKGAEKRPRVAASR
jgi:hippurate hydrolase